MWLCVSDSVCACVGGWPFWLYCQIPALRAPGPTKMGREQWPAIFSAHRHQLHETNVKVECPSRNRLPQLPGHCLKHWFSNAQLLENKDLLNKYEWTLSFPWQWLEHKLQSLTPLIWALTLLCWFWNLGQLSWAVWPWHSYLSSGYAFIVPTLRVDCRN